MNEPNLQRAAQQLLRDCALAGVSHLPRAEPFPLPAVEQPETLLPSKPPTAESRVPAATEAPAVSPIPEPASVSVVREEKPASEPVTGNRSEQLQHWAKRVAVCTRCSELAQTRTQTVFGVGNPQARVLFVGEAPGADEDHQGEPFVGKAGQLLTKIIEACGWQREDLYICNILRCRPPGNRNPTREEADNCREYLDAQIAIVSPEYIVCWGSVAAQNLLGTDLPIGRMRGTFYDYAGAKVLCTYHPSYLLRNPAAKKPVWEDMKLLLREMGKNT